MNSNLVHNILNVVIALAAAATAGLIATGCTQLPAGGLECSASWIDPSVTGAAASGLSIVKLVINIGRDGLAGLVKRQPPVQ